MVNRHKKLTAAILLYLVCGAVPVSAMQQRVVEYDGGKAIEYNILDAEDSRNIGGTLYGKDAPSDDYGTVVQYDVSDAMITGIMDAGNYWMEMLMPKSKLTVPLQVLVTTEQKFQNAAASYISIRDGKEIMDEIIADQIKNGVREEEKSLYLDFSVQEPDVKSGDYGFERIIIGDNFGAVRQGADRGWWFNAETVLPDNQQAADFVGAFRHELGHALGIGADFDRKNAMFYEERKFTAWMNHLVDQNLNPAAAGKHYMVSADFKELQKKDPTLDPKNYFIVDDLSDDKIDTLREENPHAGYAYFIGDNVSAVLDGKQFFGVDGLPVHAWEQGDMDLSHLHTPGMMSHRTYGNYTSFLEVELAVMQDMGYDFDRKAYYGYSLYKDNQTLVNTQGYSARNAEGTAYLPGVYSQVNLGVGLHIYGMGNTVTQAADILTQGAGAAGIRVDGIENNLDIPATTQIHSDGRNGRGVLFAYGRNHTLTQAGTVTANGQNGDAVTFDFGSSSNGAADEYRGSYMRYSRKVSAQDGSITSASNSLLEMDAVKDPMNYVTDELNGALINEYNLSGTLEAGRNAIYIGKNAFVDTINVLDGAKIKGDIVSDWKHLDEENDGVFATETDDNRELLVQYKTADGSPGNYNYTEYIPDLVTKLNFKTGGELAYDGNIKGPDNIKLRVASGTLQYGGTADVVSVEVAEGASVLGGSFIVNDMNDGHYKINGVGVIHAWTYPVDVTGEFVNNGTIGAVTPTDSDTSIEITGTLTSKGSLQMTANGLSRGYIDVKDSSDGAITGAVNADGSRLVIDPKGRYLPEENYLDFVRLNGEAEKIEYADEPVAYQTGLLTAVFDAENGTLKFKPQDNAGNLNAEEKETLQDMNAMYSSLYQADRTERAEMTELYNLSGSEVKSALNDIYNVDVVRGATAAQQSYVVSDAIGSRMVQVRGGNGSSLRAVSRMGDNEVIPVGETDRHGNGGWIKFSKNWGRIADGAARLHGSAMTFGYDRKVSDAWRLGALVSYNRTSFGSSRTSLKIDDWRAGIYGGYHKGAHDAYVYLDYGWQSHDQKRGVMDRRADADYKGHLLELGGEYKYDLHAEDGRIWHVSPYAGLQLSRYSQGGYRETGAGVYGMNAQGMRNTYFAGMAGLELRRELPSGSFMLRAGLKHAFRGTDPRLDFNYSGLPSRSRDIRDSRDATMATFALSYSQSLGSDWSLQADAQLDRGPHDRNLMGSLMLRKEW